jgi:hypothetical protein
MVLSTYSVFELRKIVFISQVVAFHFASAFFIEFTFKARGALS